MCKFHPAAKAALIGVLVPMLLLTSENAGAEPTDKDRAKELYKAAMEQFQAGKYLEAMSGYRASHALFPHPNNLYYGAECHRRLGELRESHQLYRQYAATLSPDQRGEFTEKLRWLRFHRPCTLFVASQPGGAMVTVDGKAVQKTALDGSAVPIQVEGGTREVVVAAEGYRPLRKVVEAEFGEPIPLVVTLAHDGGSEPAGPDRASRRDGAGPGEAAAAAGRRQAGEQSADRGKEAGPRGAATGASPGAMVTRAEEAPGGAHGRGPNIHLVLGAAFSEMGVEGLDPGVSGQAGIKLGYLLPWGRWALQLGVAVLAAPLDDKVQDTGAPDAWTVSFLTGPGVRFYFRDHMWAGASLYLGAAALYGADEHSVFFKDEEIEEVTGAFTTFALRAELGLGWHVWQGLTLAVTPLALDFSPRHEDFTPNISHLLRFHVGGEVGWQL